MYLCGYFENPPSPLVIHMVYGCSLIELLERFKSKRCKNGINIIYIHIIFLKHCTTIFIIIQLGILPLSTKISISYYILMSLTKIKQPHRKRREIDIARLQKHVYNKGCRPQTSVTTQRRRWQSVTAIYKRRPFASTRTLE